MHILQVIASAVPPECTIPIWLKGAAGGALLDISVPLLLPVLRRALPVFTLPMMALRSALLVLPGSIPLLLDSLLVSLARRDSLRPTAPTVHLASHVPEKHSQVLVPHLVLEHALLGSSTTTIH